MAKFMSEFSFNYRDILTDTHAEKKEEEEEVSLALNGFRAWKHLTGS